MFRFLQNTVTINRVIVVLLTLTVGLQVSIFLKQWRPADRMRPEAVREAPKGTGMPLSGIPVKGNSESKLVLIEFSDYECPYCARHATGAGAELDKKYIATGKMRHAFVNNPLPMHPNARLLAVAASCAGQQNKYWEAHDALFQAQPKSRSAIMTVVASLISDGQALDRCLDTQNVEATQRIEQDMKFAKGFGLEGTPSFAVGWVDDKNNVSIKKFINGSQALPVFEGVIEGMLKTGPS